MRIAVGSFVPVSDIFGFFLVTVFQDSKKAFKGGSGSGSAELLVRLYFQFDIGVEMLALVHRLSTVKTLDKRISSFSDAT